MLENNIKYNSKKLIQLLAEYKHLEIGEMIDYDKFYLYSLITHSTAIEGSTVTEIENQLLFDEGITAKGRSFSEQMMNVDLKAAYERSLILAKEHTPFTIDMLKSLSALVMRNTGSNYSTLQGDFNSANGDLRLVNVTAGVGGHSYLSYKKVEKALSEFCENINKQRNEIAEKDIISKYLLSIDAHYLLVTIHPWVDGNGRMARLVMNMLQFEFGLLPIKITKEHKSEYIKALEDCRNNESFEPFREFMFAEHINNLQSEIEHFKKDIDRDVPQNVSQNVPQNSLQESILKMIIENAEITRRQMAENLNVSVKTIARELAKMTNVKFIGPSKGGHWEIF